jgi:predicted permease
MGLLRRLIAARMRLRALFLRSRLDRDLDEELQSHVEHLTNQHMARGLAPAEARRRALVAMGGVEQRKEECRDARRTRIANDVMRDLRYSLRILRRSPGFTAAAVLSLALGIGANTAIFQLIDALALRALPVERPDRLAIVNIPGRRGASGSFSGRYAQLTYPILEELRRVQQPFTGVLAWSHSTFDLAERGESRFAENGLWVTGDYFDLLGVRPYLGRLFSERDDVPGCGAPGVVLSHAFWRREFGADPRAVGRRITVSGRPLEIIGVSQPGFFGVEVGRSFDLALPLCADPLLNPSSRLDARGAWWLAAMGRLKPDWTLATADAHLRSVSPALFRDTLPERSSKGTAESYLGFVLGASKGSVGFSTLRTEYDRPLRLLLAMTAILLLIACANLANLLFARMSARSREVAIRLALGASRGRVFRQLLLESVVLAAVGAAGGVALSAALGRAVVGMMSSDVSPLFLALGMDWRVLAFTSGLLVVTCLLFGTAPALRASHTSPEEALRGVSRTLTSGAASRTLQRALVVTQVALSLMVLAGGLVFARSLQNLFTADAGFQQRGVLELDVDLRRLHLPVAKRNEYRRMLLDRLRSTTGVESAAATMTVPLVGGWNQWVHMDYDRNAKGLVNLSGVSPGYFEALRIPLTAGRDLTPSDNTGSAGVAIVNESFARRFLGARSPLGETFRVEGAPGQPWPPITIVGVVKNTKYGDLREEFAPIVYLAAFQHTSPGEFDQVLLRGAASLPALRAAVRQTVEDTSPDIRFHFHDFQEQLRDGLMRERLMAALCGFFAVLATVLATVGVYGLIAYSAARRTQEIGIRLALGAGPTAIVALILREALWLQCGGLAIGLLLAALAARSARTLVYGIDAADPVTLLSAALLLGVIAILASSIPAIRAAKGNVIRALRCD